MDLQNILRQAPSLSSAKNLIVKQLQHEEDDALYQVWRVDTDDTCYILKEVTEKEAELHHRLLLKFSKYVPPISETITADGKTYLLMTCIEGEDLRKCDRRKLLLALDALIAIQEETWEQQDLSAYGTSFAETLSQRRQRGSYLNDPLLDEAYGHFLQAYESVPKALCHDDLLPFNLLISHDRAVLIDWEHGGFLPYPVSLARLIAHGEEAEDAFFRMTDADKAFAIDYYYHKLLKDKGVSYADWRRTLAHFLFYELCEWVYVGNRCDATDGTNYQKYLPLARAQAQQILHPPSVSNYDISRCSMEAAFAGYPQENMIARFDLRHDDIFLHLQFAGQEYRICRRSGYVERHENGRFIHASYHECAPIFDILTYSEPSCTLSGQFVTSNELPGTVRGAAPDISVYSESGAYFSGKGESLKKALANLGGQACRVGDVSAIVPMFDFFPVMVQFWDADEEFGAVLKLMWDKNATAFLRYESIAIAAGHLIRRLHEEAEKEIRKETTT